MKLRLTSLETVAMTALVVALAVGVAVTSCPTGGRSDAIERHIADADSVAAVIKAAKASAPDDSSAAKQTRRRTAKPTKKAAGKAVSRNYLDEPVNE